VHVRGQAHGDDRMSAFAAPQDAGMQKRWGLAGRVVMAAVVLGNAVGLVANAAAAVHYEKATEAMSTASVAYATKNTKDGEIFRTKGREQVDLARSISSVQLFCEVAALLLIIVAFAVVGALCARILRSRLKPIGVDAGYDAFISTVGRALQLHMLGTTAVIFVTFLLRAVFSTMNAVAFQLQDFSNNLCPGNKLCDACFNMYTHISQWMTYTPEFQLMIMLTSSPVALLVALLGMTTKATLHLMKSSKRGNLLLNDHRVAMNPAAEMSGM
jgi:hypothetical protein